MALLGSGKLREGCCFVLPLKGGGFVRGVVARQPPRCPIMLVYFFAPRLVYLEDARIDGGMKAGSEFYVERCGNGSLKNGRWTILGHLPGFNRHDWPIPLFSVATSGESCRVVQVSERDLVTHEMEFDAIDSRSCKYPDVVGGMTSPEWSVEQALEKSFD